MAGIKTTRWLRKLVMIRRGFLVGQISSDRTFSIWWLVYVHTAANALNLCSISPLPLESFTCCVFYSNSFYQCSSGPALSVVYIRVIKLCLLPAVLPVAYVYNIMTLSHWAKTGRLFLEKLIYVLFVGEKMRTFVINAPIKNMQDNFSLYIIKQDALCNQDIKCVHTQIC